MLAAAAMAFSSVFVVSNSLRLRGLLLPNMEGISPDKALSMATTTKAKAA